MRKTGFWHRAFYLYYDGFRNMTLGKTLWLIIAVKLVIIFVVLKLLFFPNFLKQHTNEGDEPEYVATQLEQRANEPITK